MAFYSVGLSRRSLMSLSSSLLHRNLHHQHFYGASFRRISVFVSSNPCFPSANLESADRRTPGSNSSHLLQWFRSTGSLPSQMEDGEIRGDGKMYKFDNNHWRVCVRFVGDKDIGREEMVEIYVAFAAKVFGSVEEANKRIYSYRTEEINLYSFNVECSWDTSRMFNNLPGVHMVLPDQSYLKPVSKKRIAESKKRQKQIAESKKHRNRICRKRQSKSKRMPKL